MDASTQLSLPVSLRPEPRFGNFVAAEDLYAEVVASLRRCASASEPSPILLWGDSGVGLTHLLQSTARLAIELGRSARYFSLKSLISAETEEAQPQRFLAGMDAQQVVCLDDVHLCSASAVWEEALFHLFNRLQQRGHALVVSSHEAPANLSSLLPDLRSRLLSGLVLRVSDLHESGKETLLRRRAKELGIELGEDVSRFLLSRLQRDNASLLGTLDRLDALSLQQQRRLTLPFVKQALGL